MRFLILFILFFIHLFADYNQTKDPYRNLTMYKLKNGLDVVLLPNRRAKNVKIDITIRVGMLNEDKEHLEITHLIEHLLFRDSSLPKNITYLQLIEEKGGEANGKTTLTKTSYIATIPAKHSYWLLDTFSKMIFERRIAKKDIPKEVKTIKLELGEVDWIARKFGFDILHWIEFNFFEMPDFEKREFGRDNNYFKYSENDRILSLEKLKYKDILKYYREYYYPSNGILFVVGNFDKERMIKEIRDKFGKFKKREGKSGKEIETNFVDKPYRYIYSDGKSIEVTYGIKFHNASPKDDIVLISYNSYLAHRLMKELRNRKGETYTVSELYFDFKELKNRTLAGVVGVTFETSKERFWDNLKYVREKIKREAKEGKISDEVIKESIKFYKQKYELTSSDVDTLMRFAKNYYYKYKLFKRKVNSYKILSSISIEEYRDILKKYYSKKNYYEEYNRPKLYSLIEENVVITLSIFFSIWIFSLLFKREVECHNISYVEEITHSPLMFIEISTLFILTSLIYYFILVRVDFLLDNSLWYNNLKYNLYYYYIYLFIAISLFVAFLFYILSLFPKTIFIENGNLVIKSIGIYAKRYSKEEIISIQIVPFFKLLKNPKIWFNYKFHFGVYDPFFWRDRILIELKDGSYYYLGVKDGKRVKRELEERLNLRS